MTVLKGELAMKDFIIENQNFIDSKGLIQIVIQTNRNTSDIVI